MRGLKRLVRCRVVVHTTDEHSIRGVLKDTYRDCLSIGEPEYLQEAQPEKLQGSVVILLEKVSWVQVL